ncbi:hypothetical protein NP493_2354g00005 [Ridgeia piscesae]|uniref:Uncharacterized protein n=1 Tax=Ridgeia piscesae TaxID=27915 RepID=A0AAD9N2Z7_RIDPI|nr:hypothetical protein NP493_2354g00005 [Ridgeia piscesae]
MELLKKAVTVKGNAIYDIETLFRWLPSGPDRPLKKVPPTDANLQLHVLRAHLPVLLWKAADQRDPPEEARNLANVGWNIESSAITPAISTVPVAPSS